VLGPAFVAAVAYVDPGNFAVNIGAGAAFGYRLAWVVLLASLLAMPVQFLAAKIGIVTGQSLPQICRARCGPAIVAAKVFHVGGQLPGAVSVAQAHAGLADLVGGGAALAFAVALLASGLSSASVGTFAGQAIMEGFLGRRGSVFIRRGITVVPALAVPACGLSPTRILVLSQVILSFGIPFALVPLVLITRSRRIMGAFAI
jgi:Mn2+/Fe2+ NRAMP family transporter